MSAPKWTPGPWRINEQGSEDTIITRTVEGKNLGGGMEVCIVTTGSYADHVELANARLIAAAPELYEALNLALPELEAIWGEMTPTDSDHFPGPNCPNACGFPKVLQAVRSALAKAVQP